MAKKKSPAKTKNIVYVVFHGLTPIVENTTTHEFRAYVLSMGDEHRYLYGDWLREAGILAGFAGELVVGAGPTTRNAALDASKRPTIELKKPVDEAQKAIHARIVLPRPDDINYGNSGALNLSDGHRCLVDPHVGLNAGVTVFRYNLNSFAGCYLVSESGSILWEPNSRTMVTVKGDDYVIAALHVFSNPPLETSDNHSLAEFNLSARVLGERAVKIGTKTVDGKPSTPPPGLCAAELLSLYKREQFLESLANKARGGTSASSTYRAKSGGGCESCCSGADGSEG